MITFYSVYWAPASIDSSIPFVITYLMLSEETHQQSSQNSPIHH